MIQLLRRPFVICALLVMSVLCIGAMSARADITISEPANGSTVRGEITVRYSGVPDGGYVIVKVDGNFAQATSQSTFSLNTFDAQSFGINQNAQTDGQHQISITGVDASGKNTSTATVTFNVANNQVDTISPPVLLTHWVPADRLEESARRYRVFAVSDGPPSGTGEGSDLDSPLDFQYSVLLRRVVRDVGMFGDAANIKTEINEAFQRKRAEPLKVETNGGATDFLDKIQEDLDSDLISKKSKQDWSPNWQIAPETGSYSVKTVKEDGEEINSTRKQNLSIVASLLPVFPDNPVQIGSRWESVMTFLTNIPVLTPITVKAPMTFTKYEDITLPSGEVRNAAKLESRFTLDNEHNGDGAKRIAAILAILNDSKLKTMEMFKATKEQQDKLKQLYAANRKIDTSKMSTKELTASTEEFTKKLSAILASNNESIKMKPRTEIPSDMIEKTMSYINKVRMDCSRVIWFDPKFHLLLRMQDSISVGFDYKVEATVSTDNIKPPNDLLSDPDSAQNPIPTKVEEKGLNYTMDVTTWYDDTIPPPTNSYNGGKGTPHSKDNVQEPSLSKITGKF